MSIIIKMVQNRERSTNFMAPRKRNDKMNMREIVRLLTCITQFGISMLVPMAMCFFGGYLLDRWLGTSFIAIVLFFVGAVAGARNVYLLAKKYFNEDKE